MIRLRRRRRRAGAGEALRDVVPQQADDPSLAELLAAARRAVPSEALRILTQDLESHEARLPFLDDTSWAALRRDLPVVLGAVGPERCRELVPAQRRILHALIVAGDRGAAERFVLRGGLRLTGRAVDGAGRLDYADLDPLGADVPPDAFVLSGAQTRLRTRIARVRLDGTDLVVSGSARIDHLDAPPHAVSAYLVEESGQELAVAAELHTAAPAGAPPTISVTVPLEQVPPGTWSIRLQVAAGELVRSGRWARPDRAAGAGRRRSHSAGPGRCVVIDEDRESCLRIAVRADGVLVHEAVLDTDDQVVLRGPGQPPTELRLVERAGGAVVPIAAIPAGAGWEARVRRNALQTATRGAVALWGARAGADAEQPVRYAALTDGSDTDPRAVAGSDGRGRLVVRVRDAAAAVLGVELEDESVVLEAAIYGVDAEQLTVTLRSSAWRGSPFLGTVEPCGGGRVRLRMPLRHPQWGQTHWLPSGRYPFEVRDRRADRPVPVLPVEDLLQRLPLEHLLGDVRVQLRTGRDGAGLGLRLSPPLGPDERSADDVARLQRLAHAGTGTAPAVLFRTLFGEATNDTALALHRELCRRDTRLALYWSVRDRSVPVPEGGIGLVEGTEEWYRMLGEARYLVVNQHEPRWYHKRPGQVMVQTFHGYPYKLMGRPWWDLKATPADLIASNYRISRDWDFLVSPSHYATGLLLDAFFDAEGREHVEVIEAGYPRNDILLDASAPAVRRRVRASLGIADDTTVVLYAPTFRDYLRVDETRARAGDFFDAAQAAEALGPSYLVLVRGHAYHAREEVEAARAPGVLDVTHHPDVAELCLASDAAVLDYSSLRFDYALLRQPMVFLVPDREEYHRMRPGLLDYDLTAPGPQVRTTAEAVRWLGDLAAVRSQYADDLERFVGRYMEREDGRSAARVVDRVFGSDAGR